MLDPRRVYLILHTLRADDGQYIPTIAVEGGRGHNPTDWKWGHDYDAAWAMAHEKNEAMGYTQKEVSEVMLSTMQGIGQ